ncbi:MAG TPA: BTAD domain-containing putative transcriptional regulator [Solirubrobacteraceae bacterium]|jgi:WD40 repeat protein/DNA-binding SARP family transcriptional activator|nr:BTAD domain-containing putative transcriptional regulator [Solirubrobacteraceae bacterium]
MDFLILGPIDVRNASGAVTLGGNKPRAVLAVLLLHANEPVSAERLALALWGEDAPGGAVKTVQVHVSRLRKALGDPDVIATSPAGYCLRVRPGELDAARFERLVEAGRRALADSQPEDAASLLREALELWRGPALAELALEPFAGSEIARLEEQRLAALELRVEADLAAGRHAEVVGELQRLVSEHPIRERLAGQLMLALYRCGRQAEALEAYGASRRVLVEQMGVEPGPQLRDLHQAILRQDVELEAQRAEAPLPAQLDASSTRPLAGRDAELAWLLARWSRAEDGAGSLVTVSGPRGSGKRRLLAEVASTIRRPGVSILYASGKGSTDRALAAVRRASEATRPTLLVVDAADQAGRGALAELARVGAQLATSPVLIVACADDALALAHLRAGDELELGALDAAAVRTIAAQYAPAPATADVPTDWLLHASEGLPSRVHEVASQWARREAARHVDAVAGRAEAGRAELRSIEAELTGGVVALQETHEREPPRGGDDGPPVVCPFKGLASYDVADARYFFGRERLVAELVARLVGAPLLGVVGPSGSGKSSLLRAGLLPALSDGMLPGSERWPQVLLRPGAHPLEELAAGLSKVEGSGRVVLAVDQFEETFTVCQDEDGRSEFVTELIEAAQDPDGRWVVVIALRADYYGRCAAYPELASMLAASNVLVRPMASDELRRAIERPAQRVGLRIDPELVDALVADVEREPGGLPLMSTALLELWQRRDGRRLRHSSYAHTGGVQGAVARLAESAFAQLDEGRQTLARGVLMRLVGSGDGNAVERRRVALDELEIERDEDVARVVALLTDSRLLTVSAGAVELAHEALLREWPRLCGWIDEDRDGLRIQRGLSAAAEEWDRFGRDEGALFRGTRLGEAVEWRDSRQPVLNRLEREFLAAGEAVRASERVSRRRRARLMLGAIGTVIVALVAVGVAALFVRHEHSLSASRNLASQSFALLNVDPALALVLAQAALDRANTPEAERALRQATLEDRATASVRAHKIETMTVDASSNGGMVVSGGKDGKVALWRTGGLRRVRTLANHRAPVTSAVFSPDASRVASAGDDGRVILTPTAGGPGRTLHAFAGAEHAHRVAMTAGTVAAGTTAGAVWLLPTAEGARPYVLGRHPAVRDPDTGKPSVVKVVVAISPDGTKVFSADNKQQGFIWDVASRTPTPVAVADLIYAVSFSHDGERVASAGDHGHVRIFDAATGARLKDLPMGDRQLFSVRFSPDDSHVLTTGDDHVVLIADVQSGQQLTRMAAGSAAKAAFTGDDSVVTAGGDGTLQEWSPLEVKTPRRSPSLPDFTFPTFTPGGGQVVSGDLGGGGVHLWDLRDGDRALTAQKRITTVTAPSADGSQLVSAADDETVRAFDLESGAQRDLRFPKLARYAVAMSKTGRIAAAGDADGEAFPIDVRDADGGHSLRLVGHTDLIDSLDFSPDGKQLASASWDGTARIWDLATGKVTRTIEADGETARWVSYSDDNKRVATAGADGAIRIWPLDGGDPVVLVGHEGPVNTVEFNGRGDRVVSTGLDGTVRIWDASGGDTLVVLVRHRGVDGSGADFSPDGRDVVSSGADGMRVTRCEVCDSFAAVERLAGTRPPRPLSANERARLDV